MKEERNPIVHMVIYGFFSGWILGTLYVFLPSLSEDPYRPPNLGEALFDSIKIGIVGGILGIFIGFISGVILLLTIGAKDPPENTGIMLVSFLIPAIPPFICMGLCMWIPIAFTAAMRSNDINLRDYWELWLPVPIAVAANLFATWRYMVRLKSTS